MFTTSCYRQKHVVWRHKSGDKAPHSKVFQRKSPNICCNNVVTAIAAVSARRVRPPSVTIDQPVERASLSSSSVHPPSEPSSAKSEDAVGGRRRLNSINDCPSRSENRTRFCS